MAADCRQPLIERLDDQLDASVRADVDAHLRDCLPCRRRVREIQQVRGLLKAIPEYSAPEPAPSRRPSQPAARSMPGRMAASLLVAFAAVLLTSPHPSPIPPPIAAAPSPTTASYEVQVDNHHFSVVTEGEGVELLDLAFEQDRGPGFHLSIEQ